MGHISNGIASCTVNVTTLRQPGLLYLHQTPAASAAQRREPSSPEGRSAVGQTGPLWWPAWPPEQPVLPSRPTNIYNTHEYRYMDKKCQTAFKKP